MADADRPAAAPAAASAAAAAPARAHPPASFTTKHNNHKHTSKRHRSPSPPSSSSSHSLPSALLLSPDLSPEIAAWLRSPAIQRRLHNTFALKPLLENHDRLKGAIDKLLTHQTNGTVPHSLLPKIDLSLGITTAALQTRQQDLLSAFQRDSLSLLIDARKEQLATLEQKITSFLDAERNAITAVAPPPPAAAAAAAAPAAAAAAAPSKINPLFALFLDAAPALAPSAPQAISPSELHTEAYMTAFADQCRAIAQSIMDKAAASKAAAVARQVEDMHLEERTAALAAPAIADIINNKIDEQLKRRLPLTTTDPTGPVVRGGRPPPRDHSVKRQRTNTTSAAQARSRPSHAAGNATRPATSRPLLTHPLTNPHLQLTSNYAAAVRASASPVLQMPLLPMPSNTLAPLTLRPPPGFASSAASAASRFTS